MVGQHAQESTTEILHDSIDITYRVQLTNFMDNDFIAIYGQLGIGDTELARFLDSLKISTTHLGVHEWVSQRTSVLKLKNEPLQLKHTAIDGMEIDLEKLRGKVVLVDFWNTNCLGCIRRMPAIKEVYDKYRSKGFEVISIATDPETKMEQIKKIKNKIGASWPTLVIGGKNHEEHSISLTRIIWNKYGFSGVPQLLLLDKRGQLVMLNDLLRKGNFEPLVRKLLTEKH